MILLFTIIEIIVAVAIIGLLVTIGLASAKGMKLSRSYTLVPDPIPVPPGGMPAVFIARQRKFLEPPDPLPGISISLSLDNGAFILSANGGTTNAGGVFVFLVTPNPDSTETRARLEVIINPMLASARRENVVVYKI